MDNYYRHILQIATDALSLKFKLQHSSLYWMNEESGLADKASISSEPGSPADESRYTISQSMMGAIRSPLLIKKLKVEKPYLQILIPLLEGGERFGMLAFWGELPSQDVNGEDKKYLDMIGLMSLQILKSLDAGELPTQDKESDISGDEMLAEEIEDEIGFIEIDFGDEEEFEIETTSIDDEEELQFVPEDFEEQLEGKAIDIDESEIETDKTKAHPKFEQVEDVQPDTLYQHGLELFLRFSGLGFIVFDVNCDIQKDHILTHEAFFGDHLKDKSALDLLFGWGEAANPASASFQKNPDYQVVRDLLKNVFSRVTDIDVFKELMPSELQTSNATYALDYQYLKSSRTVKNDVILVVFKDVSTEKNLKFQFDTEAERANMIIKVALDVDGYYQYRSNTEKIFEHISNELSSDPSDLQLDKILHHLQDIQGGAEIYEINEITKSSDNILATIESLLSKDSPATSNEIKELKGRIELLQDTFQHLQIQYLDNLVSDEKILDKAIYRVTRTKLERIKEEILENVIKQKLDDLEQILDKNYKPFTKLKSLEDITRKRLHRLKKYIREHVAESGSKEIEELMTEFRKQPIGLMFKRYAIIAVNLGERQKKRVEVAIKGAEIEVPFHALEHLFTSLTFVIRNCVEHGLETIDERMAQDKSLEGNINIEANLANSVLQIIISDDGKGIDIEKIKTAAIENHVVMETEIQDISDDEVLKLMFKKGFSTKKDAKGTFGRGVGLSSVGTAVDELGGEINIQTQLNKGTTIEVNLPLEI